MRGISTDRKTSEGHEEKRKEWGKEGVGMMKRVVERKKERLIGKSGAGQGWEGEQNREGKAEGTRGESARDEHGLTDLTGPK